MPERRLQDIDSDWIDIPVTDPSDPGLRFTADTTILYDLGTFEQMRTGEKNKGKKTKEKPKMPLFYEGEKVPIPNKKSIGDPIGMSNVIKRASEDKQNYLYVYYDNSSENNATPYLLNKQIADYCNDYKKRGKMAPLKKDIIKKHGDAFLESDLKKYKFSTNKILKNSPFDNNPSSFNIDYIPPHRRPNFLTYEDPIEDL